VRVAIHQPEFLPWLGFFHKASLADALILLDDVQYRKNYFQNRNRVRTAQGWSWVTVPVEHAPLDTAINQIRVAGDGRWRGRLEKTVTQAYGRAPYFEATFGALRERLSGGDDRLVSLTEPLIAWLLEQFGLTRRLWRSSALAVAADTPTEKLLRLCQAVGATTYVSGISGRDYLDVSRFEQAGVAVEFQDFRHPVYAQLHAGFVPQISAIEAVFLLGPACGQLLAASWPTHLETVFA